MTFAVTFKSITIKNFLSIGNTPIRYELDSGKKILITGVNGNGKSILQEALIFACFGVSYRKINKPLLVNWFNKRDCLVTLELESGGNTYVIDRGIAPNIFNIDCNGKRVDSQTSIGELQNWFETNVLHMNYQTAVQVVVLGSANYTPFMKLEAAKRRELVENLLDITVFTTMNKLLKQRIDANKQEILSRKTEQQTKLKFLESMEVMKTSALSEKQAELVSWKQKGLDLIQQRSKLLALIATRTPLGDSETTLSGALSTAVGDRRALQIARDSLVKRLEFFGKTNVCSECSQKVPHDHSEKMRATLMGEFASAEFEIGELEYREEEIKRQLTEIGLQKNIIRGDEVALNALNTELDSVKRFAVKTIEEIQKIEAASNDGVSGQIAKLKEELIQLDEQLKINVLTTIKHDTTALLLKDNGIKAAVIKQSIPTINSLINQYLNKFEFHVRFEFDENFNETITGTGYKDLVYNSFSMGQRFRVDLAMIFAFRDVARMNAKADCNVAVLDEIMDGSMDAKGVDDMLDIISRCLEDHTVFIISHKNDISTEKFDEHYHVDMVNGFTKIAKV